MYKFVRAYSSLSCDPKLDEVKMKTKKVGFMFIAITYNFLVNELFLPNKYYFRYYPTFSPELNKITTVINKVVTTNFYFLIKEIKLTLYEVEV